MRLIYSNLIHVWSSIRVFRFPQGQMGIPWTNEMWALEIITGKNRSLNGTLPISDASAFEAIFDWTILEKRVNFTTTYSLVPTCSNQKEYYCLSLLVVGCLDSLTEISFLLWLPIYPVCNFHNQTYVILIFLHLHTFLVLFRLTVWFKTTWSNQSIVLYKKNHKNLFKERVICRSPETPCPTCQNSDW